MTIKDRFGTKMTVRDEVLQALIYRNPNWVTEDILESDLSDHCKRSTNPVRERR